MPAVTQVVAIDEREAIRDAICANFPAVVGRSCLAEAVDDVDGVVVATPPVSHFDLTAAAIAAGKHVLVEKPIATDSKQAAEMVRLAEEAGVTLASGHTFAHNPAVWKLRELIDAGELGTIHHIDAARLSLGLYRDDVNVLWDLAAHDISIAIALLRAVPDTVSAWGSRNTPPYSEDVATMRMTFERKKIDSTVRVSWLDPLKVRRTTIVGSEKMAVYNDIDPDERIKIYDRGRSLPADPASLALSTGDSVGVTYRNGDIHSPHVDFGEPLRHELIDFVGCCTSGSIPLADGRAGLAVVATLEAADQSLLENGAPVPVQLPDIHSQAHPE
jgi:predicted dehydrogenase